MGLFKKNPFKEIAKEVKKTVQQPLKAVGKIAAAPLAGTGFLLKATGANKVLENPMVDKLTFGLSGDYAGYNRGIMQAAKGQHISKEYIEDGLRFGAKVGGAVFGAPLLGVGTSSLTATNFAGAQLLQGAIKSGDLGAIGNAGLNLAGAGDWAMLPTKQPSFVGGSQPQDYASGPSFFAPGGAVEENQNILLAGAAALGVFLVIKKMRG